MKRDGTTGPRGDRQRIQIERTRDNVEWINPGLAGRLQAFEYPLHFIDFETTALAIPYHAGMRPYESVAFQWSCHTIAEPGANPVHSEWINVTDVFPNFAFADSLMRQIGTSGTVFRYASHETTILRAIRAQMDLRRYRIAELERWLDEMSAKDRMVDMYRLTLENYYHPLMKGKNSIKAVVEAIWKTNTQLRASFPEYVREIDGEVVSPYAALPTLEIQGQPVAVAEGTGAMRAYEAMMYGLEKDNPSVKQTWQRLLQQYCRLDTAAMVMLWRHWVR